MAKWKDKRNPAPLIRRIENIRFVKDDGQIELRGDGLLTVPARIEKIVELNDIIAQEDKHIIVWSAIRNAAKKGALASDTVIEEIGKLEKNYLSKKEQKFILISTLSINPQKQKLPNLQIDGNRITFSPKTLKKFIQNIAESQIIKLQRPEIKIPNAYTWVMVTVSAKGIHNAVEKASKALNLFRGELNYSINYGIRSFSSGARPKPINKIRYGPIHTLHKPDGTLVDDIFWYEEDNFELAEAYRDGVVGRFERIMNSLSEFRRQLSKSKIKEILKDSILLYNSALDSHSFDTAFIKLWATLELLTGTGRSSYDITVRRTAFIYKDVQAMKDHLNILRDCRNDLVHKGYMEGQKEILLYDLKLFVERLIDFLLWNVQGLKDFGEVQQLLDSSPIKKDVEKKLRIYSIAQKLCR